MTESNDTPKFTERELKVMCVAFQCLKTAPEVDYNRMASMLGMTNPKSAANAMAAVRKKIEAVAPADGDETSAAAGPKKVAGARGANATAPRKRTARGGGESQAKRARASKKTRKRVEGEEREGEDGSEGDAQRADAVEPHFKSEDKDLDKESELSEVGSDLV